MIQCPHCIFMPIQLESEGRCCALQCICNPAIRLNSVPAQVLVPQPSGNKPTTCRTHMWTPPCHSVSAHTRTHLCPQPVFPMAHMLTRQCESGVSLLRCSSPRLGQAGRWAHRRLLPIAGRAHVESQSHRCPETSSVLMTVTSEPVCR